jgi:diguanylate cyclase (GGDEF)-like protein/PAS domain S-box-containing protein
LGLEVVYVVIGHGVGGVIAPGNVYCDGGRARAAIRGAFVLAAVAAGVLSRRRNEDMRASLREAHREAHEQGERFRQAFQSGVTGMALEAPDGSYLSVNRALCEMTGYSEAELLANNFKSITHPADLGASIEQYNALVAGAIDTYQVEKRYVHRDGHDVWVSISVSGVRDEDGQLQYLVMQAHDVTERRRSADELAHRALHDPLTGLPNRALFLDRLSHALVQLGRDGGPVAVLFVDLDRFKLVNDGLGHDVGDEVLLEAARRLTGAARSQDTVSRFGGDEFTILCEKSDLDSANLVAERVLQAFARPFIHGAEEFHLSVSVGVSLGDRMAADPDGLLRDADRAMYVAKQHGRGRIELFDPGAPTARVNWLATESALRRALRDGQLRLHYQPVVNLTSLRVMGLEALIRWDHPERGMVAPGEFIPIAEETGLIIGMGEWVIREACSQLAGWHRDGVVDAGVGVAVNISARQLSHPGFPATVALALAFAELDAAALCLEITESSMINDPGVALANLHSLKQMGLSIALDDFGTGFSSFSQFRGLPPIEVIKIDRSFTAGLGTSDSDKAVVIAVLSLARSMGIVAVAEGVETAAQMVHLRTLGCDVAQGFYFGRPQSPEELEATLAAGSSSAAYAAAGADPGRA